MYDHGGRVESLVQADTDRVCAVPLPQTLGDPGPEEMAKAMADLIVDNSGTDDARLTGFTHPPGVAGRIGWKLIALDGELDLCSGPLLAATLLASVSHLGRAEGVVVDVTYVEFIDSSGLDALRRCRDHLRISGMDLVVRNPSFMFMRMLDILDEADLVEEPNDRRECRPAC